MQWFRKRLDLVLALLVFLVVNVLLGNFQKPISFNRGLEWDGVYYAKMTQDFRDGQRPETIRPFVSRIGAPYLASFLGRDIISSWRVLGVIANCLTLILLYVLFCQFFEERWVRFVLLLLFIIPFHSVVRRVWYVSLSTDQWDKVFLVGGLVLLQQIREKGWCLSLLLPFCFLSFVGVFFREIVIVLPVSALFVANPFTIDTNRLRALKITMPPAVAWLPVVAAVSGVFLVRQLIVPTSGDSFIRTAFGWLFQKTMVQYILAWFVLCGPLLIFPLHDWKNTARFLMNHQYLLVYMLGFSVLAWIGGAATYRLLQWTMPALFILFGISFSRCWPAVKGNWPFLSVLAVSFIVSQRVFMLMPDWPGGISTFMIFTTPLSSNPPVLDIIGMGSDRSSVLMLVSNLLMLGALLWLMHPPKIQFFEKRPAGAISDPNR